MHEYALVEALVRRAEEAARARHPAAVVRRLSVSLGELSGVDPELFRGAYELARAGTGCAGAELALHTVPARWRCPGCGAAVAPGAPLRCPACDRPARLEPGGDALTLEALELEVP